MSSSPKQQPVADEPGHFVEGSPTRLAYGINAAAAALDLSRSRLYELISEGEIGTCKVGKRTIIPATEMAAFLDRHRVDRLAPGTAVPSPQMRLAPSR